MHVPMIGETLLRMRSKKWSGRVSVPVLIHGAEVIADSLAIAQHVERIGSGTPLFAPGREAEIARWSETSARALAAGRSLVVTRLAASREAHVESLPPFVPRALRKAMAPLAAQGIRFVGKKYDVAAGLADAYGVLAGACASLEEALSGRETLIDGGFGYADIEAAIMLQCVRPSELPEARHVAMGRAVRECWTEPSLAKRFAGLLEWRDGIYARHRPRPIGA
jgi:glutathione S-transferase